MKQPFKKQLAMSAIKIDIINNKIKDRTQGPKDKENEKCMQ